MLAERPLGAWQFTASNLRFWPQAACRWPPAKLVRHSAHIALVHALHYNGPCLRLGDSIAVESRCTSVTIRRHTST
jgi:hypothetical protein